MLIFNPTRQASWSILAVLSWICCLVEEFSTTSSPKSRSSNLDVNFHLIPFSPWPIVLLITQSITIKNKTADVLHPCLTPVLMPNHMPISPWSSTAHLHEVFIEYFYHSNDLLWDSVFLRDWPHVFAVNRVECIFKFYEVQIECCLLLGSLLNDAPQYKYLFCRPSSLSISFLSFLNLSSTPLLILSIIILHTSFPQQIIKLYLSNSCSARQFLSLIAWRLALASNSSGSSHTVIFNSSVDVFLCWKLCLLSVTLLLWRQFPVLSHSVIPLSLPRLRLVYCYLFCSQCCPYFTFTTNEVSIFV